MHELDRRRFLHQTALAACLAPLPLAGRAEERYPARPIRIVCPFTPGGGSDFMARTAARVLGERLEQSVIVDNRPGAGGTLGCDHALRSPADGYTLLLIAGSYTVNPSLYKLRFDPVADMTPVIQLSKGAYVLCVNAALPFKTLVELLAHGRQNPGRISFASAGTGSHLHIVTEYLFGMAGVQATHVPYKGTGPAINDLLAGQVDVLVAGTEALMQHVKGGRLRALAVTTAQRLRAYPDIPAVAECGLPQYDVVAWHGLIAPKGLPAAIQTSLNSQLDAGLQSPALLSQLEPTGVLPAGGKPEAFAALIQAEIPRYAKVVREHKIQT
ncbi:MAG: tripartite tricarboxylate transporter substrate binding protein [Curvibacter sp.]|nr:tripartite tricarboxylate transporter substrate binding protein [Curvibacter sp.]